MSFNIPVSVEQDIRQYADAQNMSVDEAITSLLKAGLNWGTLRNQRTSPSGLGLFSSPEDIAALDAAVALAYEERHRPSGRPAEL